MLELSLREQQGPVSIADIARAQQIPPRFLEAILRELKQAGYTESVRGKEGGYLLSRPAALITMKEIMELFEGPFVAGAGHRGEEGKSPFDRVWSEAEIALAEVYERQRFDELAAEARAQSPGYIVDYTI